MRDDILICNRWVCRVLMLSVLCVLITCGSSAIAYQMEDNVIRHAHLGEGYLSLRRYDEATAEFQIALRLNPYSSMAASIYNNLGFAYRKQQNYPMAIAAFQRAISIQPNFELYYKNLIETYQDYGALADARQAFIRILKLNPNDAEAWYLLGLIFEKTGEGDSAKTAFLNFLRLEPNARLARSANQHL